LPVLPVVPVVPHVVPPVVPPVITEVTKPITEPVTPVSPVNIGQVLQTAGLIGAGVGAVNAVTGTPPVTSTPPNWGIPPPTGVAPFTPLPPIDFGNRNLLIGTQWEKFLSPTYGQVPEPVKFSQPSNMSYNDLMTILNGNQTPSRSNLSINDIISGIQNQYGQTPVSTVGQKSA
jgi:hypothetical protein